MAVDLNLLPVFLAVAEQGSFTGAAHPAGYAVIQCQPGHQTAGNPDRLPPD